MGILAIHCFDSLGRYFFFIQFRSLNKTKFTLPGRKMFRSNERILEGN